MRHRAEKICFLWDLASQGEPQTGQQGCFVKGGSLTEAENRQNFSEVVQVDTKNSDTANKKQIEVLIGGKLYKLATYDSEDYIKAVAEYVDKKYSEIAQSTDSLTRLSEYFPVMLALNITDDLFKAAQNGGNVQEVYSLKAQIRELSERLERAAALLEEKDGLISELEERAKEQSDISEEQKAALDATNALREENKALREMITDAGLIPPSPDKNGRIKDKDKDRKTLLKDLNDIKSENGRTKKENKALLERVAVLEQELEVLKKK